MTSPINNSVLLKSGLAAQDATFKLRVSAGIACAASDIMREDEGTPDHYKRKDLAVGVASSPASYVDRFLWACAADTRIAALVVPVDQTSGRVAVNCTDELIMDVVKTTWNIVAGV